MTGAMLPHGTEAVVPVELDRRRREPGRHPRQTADYGHVGAAGGRGRQGRRGPGHRGHQAAARCTSRSSRRPGRGAVLVRPRPRVVVLSTGNELAEPGTPIIPGRIWDSNSFMIAAAAREAGCLAYRHAILPDHPDEVLPAIEDQLAPGRPDDHHRRGQHGRRARRGQGGAAAASAPSAFRKVAMQPGMPQGFGTVAPARVRGAGRQRRRPAEQAAGLRREVPESPVAPGEHERVPIFTLPGNPVSAYVSFQIFVRPAIGRAAGLRRAGPGEDPGRGDRPAALAAGPALVRCAACWTAPAGRIAPLTGQESHQVATLGKADALIIVPEQVDRAGRRRDRRRPGPARFLRAKGAALPGRRATKERGGKACVKSARRRAGRHRATREDADESAEASGKQRHSPFGRKVM